MCGSFNCFFQQDFVFFRSFRLQKLNLKPAMKFNSCFLKRIELVQQFFNPVCRLFFE